jgi:hypothetical protein
MKNMPITTNVRATRMSGNNVATSTMSSDKVRAMKKRYEFTIDDSNMYWRESHRSYLFHASLTRGL